ncbi:hypothetical protein ACLQ3K_25615 [Tsukamurella sp. DT100]|uniref:hypothetical protein n=1 Tax=Tsukamurella sp. DT100 TaxID=3393415 RepID=UPI003CF97110
MSEHLALSLETGNAALTLAVKLAYLPHRDVHVENYAVDDLPADKTSAKTELRSSTAPIIIRLYTYPGAVRGVVNGVTFGSR